MSDTPFVRKKVNTTVQTFPEVMARVFNLKPLTWGEYFFGRSLTEAIVGAAVYKYTLRGEKTNDVDVVCDDARRFSELFTKNTYGAYCPDGEVSNDCSFSLLIQRNYNRIEFSSKMCHIDVGTFLQFAQHIDFVGLDMTNSLILTASGIRHVLGKLCLC